MSKKATKKDSSSSSDDDAEEENGNADGDAGDDKAPEEHAGKTELFVQSLSFDTTEDSLNDFFKPHGTLTKVKLLRGKGKAFIEFEKHE